MVTHIQTSHLLCLIVIAVIGAASSLRPGGRNVCSRNQQYTAYEARRHTQVRYEGYRTCCRRIFGGCVKRCTRYRSRHHVYYTAISHTRWRPVYFCCDGWRSSGQECNIPVCLTPCKHGNCIWPNTCRCHPGFKGPYCRQDINECSAMKLPDFSQVVTSSVSKVASSTPIVSSSAISSSSTASSSTKLEVVTTSSRYTAPSSSSVASSHSSSSLEKSSSVVSTKGTSTITPSSSDTSTKSSSTSIKVSPSVSISASVLSTKSPLKAQSSTSVQVKETQVKASESKIIESTASGSTRTQVPSAHPAQSTLSPVSSQSVKPSSVTLPDVRSSTYTLTSTPALKATSSSNQKVSVATEISSLTTDTIDTLVKSQISTSIAPASSSVLFSSVIGSGFGSGDGSGLGSGSEPEIDYGHYTQDVLQRKRRNIDEEIIHEERETSKEDPAVSYAADQCSHTCQNTYGSFVCGCYKGFYLDKNKRTCHDINECSTGNGGCSHRCINTVGSYRCDCPHPALYLSRDGKTCKAHGMSIVCTKDYMQVNFERKLLKGLEVQHLRLADPSCTGHSNSTHLILRTELDKCGTVYFEKDDSEIYKNVVINRDITIGNLITRIRGIEVPFQCVYKRSAHVTGVGFLPDRHRLTFTEDGFGQFTFTMSMFHSSRYRRTYSHSDFPIKVELRDRVYFEVKVISEDAGLAIFLERCSATPYLQRGKGPEYVFLENGCTKDPTLHYSVYGLHSYQRFSLEAFRFLADVPNVYIHCDVLACHKSNKNSRCHRGCQPRGKRSITDLVKKETKTYTIAEGPLSLRSRRSIENAPRHNMPKGIPASQYTYFAAGLACSVLLVASIQVFRKLRSRHQKHGYQLVSSHDRID